MVRDWDEGPGYCFEPDYQRSIFATHQEATMAAECGAKEVNLNWAEVTRQRYVNGRGWVTTAIWRNDGDEWYVPEVLP